MHEAIEDQKQEGIIALKISTYTEHAAKCGAYIVEDILEVANVSVVFKKKLTFFISNLHLSISIHVVKEYQDARDKLRNSYMLEEVNLL